jgi:zinc transport system substrate-binding protein
MALAGPVRSPTMQQLRDHIREARNLGIRTIFVQPEESRRHAEILADAIGARVVEIDPLAADWEAEIRRVAQRMVNAFRMEKGS